MLKVTASFTDDDATNLRFSLLLLVLLSNKSSLHVEWMEIRNGHFHNYYQKNVLLMKKMLEEEGKGGLRECGYFARALQKNKNSSLFLPSRALNRSMKQTNKQTNRNLTTTPYLHGR
jgi:hypothetical protein